MLTGRALSDSRFQIDALDGLRGLAVLMVFVSHASKNHMNLLPGLDLSGIGKSGVYLFFLLSSFLLTLPFLEKGKSAFTFRPMANYFVRRFFRIYPLFIFYLLTCVLGTWLVVRFDVATPLGGIPFALSWSELLDHLLLQKGYSVTWSIPVEFRYYFVLPLVAALYVFIVKARLWLSIIVSVLLIAATQILWPQSSVPLNSPYLGPYLCIFLMGAALAVIYHYWKQSPLQNSPVTCSLIEWSGWFSLVLIACMTPSFVSLLMQQQVSVTYFHRQFLLYGLLWSMVLLACVGGRGRMTKFFGLPILRYFGFISFSLYLFHITAIKLLVTFVPELPVAAWIALAMSVAIAHLTWTFIEKPSAKIRIH